MVIHKCPSNSLFLMFHFFDACCEGRQTFIPVLPSFHKECCLSFKKKNLNSEISPSFPLRLKLAWINWTSAVNKEEKMNSFTLDVKHLLCQKKTKD